MLIYNLQETYVDDSDPCMGILEESVFTVRSTYHMTKDKSTGQLVFGQDMILHMNHVADWMYIRQRKQLQINKYVICENTIRTNYYYIVGDKVMTLTKSAYKFKTLFKGLYENFHTCKYGTVNLLT